MESIRKISKYLEARFHRIGSIKELHEFNITEKLPAIAKFNDEPGKIWLNLFLYTALFKFLNIELKDEQIKSISAKISKRFPEFTLADIYYVLKNAEKCQPGILYYLQVYNKIVHWFEKHQDEKIIYQQLVE